MKKSFWLACVLFALTANTSAQLRLPAYPDSVFSTYYQQRVTHFKTLPKTPRDIIFLGNSITDGAEWSELLGDSRIKNRGISGDITAGVINRLDEITNRKPAKVFLLIGVNDLSRNIAPDSVVKNILFIVGYIHQQTPSTRLYVQSILPVNDVYGKFSGHTNKTGQIDTVNAGLQRNAPGYHYTYIDIHTPFCDENGKMRAGLTNDGLHLKGEAYLLWKHLIYPYIFNLQYKPSLLPLPRSLQWKPGFFPAYKCHAIIAGKSLQKERNFLQKTLQAKGIRIVDNDTADNMPYIELRLQKIKAPQTDEAYDLQVAPGKIVITANNPHGIFNGIQTLLQLLRDNVIIDACSITDWPAFAWRGYMVDVGRNFQSVEQLEQQIDKMALYKLNVFHLHLTEDIAWRLYINRYPQLTEPANMIRDKGMYYTPDDIRGLIAYCEERQVEFVPEIDMPGHSDAFRRCFDVDMQSSAGIVILKNILKEVLEAYHFKYLHIGGDEVKITNPDFLPEIIRFIQQYNVQTIGWSPGGNLPRGTIHQLWSANEILDKDTRYIDSRHLYLNHFDPLESVVTIFNREFDNVMQGDATHPGAEICLWNDRAVDNEKDLLRMNPVYPAMLAFAERSWRGGGKPGWTAVIGSPNSEENKTFSEFEARLLDQGEENFEKLPFLYNKQANLVWNLYGPYENQGDVSKQFAPEQDSSSKLTPALTVTGGTVILRHWWYPLVQGVISSPDKNTTWYATTQIYSAEDTVKGFWIGFNDLSRSYATDSPPAGNWDGRQSTVWVNGNLIKPPLWKHAGRSGNIETPLVDEGYAYRKPTPIHLKKGRNTVLIKLPVGSFTGKDWNNPVKWMFTFLPSHFY